MGTPLAGYILNVLSIVLIDVLLGGDNAVVIALAVRSLPKKDRRIGIAAGAAGAVALRIVLTFFAARLLQLNYVKFVGGILVTWIAIQLLAEGNDNPEAGRQARSLWQAMWMILVADVTMSIDNILAVAAASKGNLGLLIFGLGLSIPFVVFTSNLLSIIMDRYPVVVYLGALLLGRIGGQMIVEDPWLVALLHPSREAGVAVQAVFAIGVVAVGKALARRRNRGKCGYQPRS
jgi:YjbE family integral membrane protein